MTADYVEYIHAPGYGQHDHLAAEVIDRALRALGDDTAGSRVAQHCGLSSHPVPMSAPSARLRWGPGVAARMRTALRAALAEMPCRVDCSIEVVRTRTRRMRQVYSRHVVGYGPVRETSDWRIKEHMRSGRWVAVARDEITDP